LTRESPEGTCFRVSFGAAYAVGAGGQVALEDYARVLTGAQGAEAVPAPDDPAHVGGLHLCAPAEPPREDVLEDIEAFAREMAQRAGDGLGWS
jgi:hypothetical protein